MNKRNLYPIAFLLLPLLLFFFAGCQRNTARTPSAPSPAPSPSVTPDPTLLDDGLDEALEELDAVE